MLVTAKLKQKAVLALICHPTDPNLFLGISRKHNLNDFGLIGGKMVSLKETVRDALAREVKKETGLTLVNMKPVFNRFNSDGRYKSLVRTYLVQVKDFKISTTEQGVVKWVTKQELFNSSFGSYNHRLFSCFERQNNTSY